MFVAYLDPCSINYVRQGHFQFPQFPRIYAKFFANPMSRWYMAAGAWGTSCAVVHVSFRKFIRAREHARKPYHLPY